MEETEAQKGTGAGGLSDGRMSLVFPSCLLPTAGVLQSQTSNGSTPLHLAAREGLMSIVKVLVKNGADVHTRDARGYKAIDYCKLWNDRPCAR